MGLVSWQVYLATVYLFVKMCIPYHVRTVCMKQSSNFEQDVQGMGNHSITCGHSVTHYRRYKLRSSSVTHEDVKNYVLGNIALRSQPCEMCLT